MYKYFTDAEILHKNGDLLEVKTTTYKEEEMAILVRVINDGQELEIMDAGKLTFIIYGNIKEIEKIHYERKQIMKKHKEKLFKLIRLEMITKADDDTFDYYIRELKQEKLKRNQTKIFYNKERTGRYETKYDYFIINEEGNIEGINWIMEDYLKTGYGDHVQQAGFNLKAIN